MSQCRATKSGLSRYRGRGKRRVDSVLYHTTMNSRRIVSYVGNGYHPGRTTNSNGFWPYPPPRVSGPSTRCNPASSIRNSHPGTPRRGGKGVFNSVLGRVTSVFGDDGKGNSSRNNGFSLLHF